MDESALKKIMDDIEVPPVDENAQKRAVNLAVAEFKAHQNEKSQKSAQGTSFLSRLIGRSTPERGSKDMKMNKGFVFGGMGTALAVVLVAGLYMKDITEKGQTSTGASATALPSVMFNVVGDMSVAPPASEVSAPPGTAEASPAYVQAVEEANEEDMERAIISSNSTIPVPIEAPSDRLQLAQESRADAEQPKAPTSDQYPAARAKTDEGMAVAELKKSQAEGSSAPAQNSATDTNAKGFYFPSLKNKTAKETTPRAEMADKDMSAPAATTPGYAGQSNVIYPEPYPYPQPVPVPVPPPDYYPRPYYQEQGRDRFPEYKPNSFKVAQEEPVSTFSSDVDTASYSFMRRELNNGRLPPAQSVRIEEMVNYFHYNYPVPESREEPFQPTVTIVDSPWTQGRKLMQIGIKGYEITGEKPHSNLVFLLDVSGSMDSPDKLPLLKNSMKLLLDSLQPDDTVSIVVYAGAAGTVLAPTKVSERSTIYNALDNLQAGGSTAGGAGIELAYNLAEQNFNKEAVNRVILATDGDFNVGITNRDQLKDYVAKKRETGIFLSVLGFGQGNYNDDLMQALAQNGNGVAAYIDTLSEARKVLLDEASSTLFPIAKDVKFQIEFNTAKIAEYRLIGYETRHLNREDFNNDKVDAGDMGAGHTVTAIYEFVPVGSASARTVDDLRYAQKDAAKPAIEETASDSPFANEYAFLKIRYKLPNENTSHLITRPVTAADQRALQKIECGPADSCPASASDDTRFAVAVAAFGQILRGEVNMADYTLDNVIALAQDGKGADEFGYRTEFINLVRLAKAFEHRQ